MPGDSLRGIDPRIPFALSSAALALVTLGLVAAERGRARSGAVWRGLARPGSAWLGLARAAAARAEPATAPSAVLASAAGPAPVVIAAALLAALAFQVHVFIDSAPLHLRQAPPTQLPMLSLVFWIGFNLAIRRRDLVSARPGHAGAHGQRRRRMAEGAGARRRTRLVAGSRLAGGQRGRRCADPRPTGS